jgi:flagellar basal-body rod protein FlgG
MAAHEVKLDVLANNLANADTAGFKADLITIGLSDESPRDLSDPASRAGSVVPGRAGLDPSPGILKPTGNPLDLAIVGRGLFAVETPQGERYTRAGSFTRDSNGFLTTPEGFRVLGTTGPIRVPEGGMQVDAQGRLPDGASLRIVAGPDGLGLVKVGLNLFAVPDGAPRPPDLPEATLIQGRLESSNVNVVRTMVEMLATLRTYEAYQRTIQALDQTAGQAANELGRA